MVVVIVEVVVVVEVKDVVEFVVEDVVKEEAGVGAGIMVEDVVVVGSSLVVSLAPFREGEVGGDVSVGDRDKIGEVGELGSPIAEKEGEMVVEEGMEDEEKPEFESRGEEEEKTPPSREVGKIAGVPRQERQSSRKQKQVVKLGDGLGEMAVTEEEVFNWGEDPWEKTMVPPWLAEARTEEGRREEVEDEEGGGREGVEGEKVGMEEVEWELDDVDEQTGQLAW